MNIFKRLFYKEFHRIIIPLIFNKNVFSPDQINKLHYLATIILKDHVDLSFYFRFQHDQAGWVGHEFGPSQAN